MPMQKKADHQNRWPALIVYSRSATGTIATKLIWSSISPTTATKPDGATKRRSTWWRNRKRGRIKIKKGLTFDKDLFKSLSNDASRAKTHTNHIINNTKTNNQRVVCERTSSSTRLQSYDFIVSLQIIYNNFLEYFTH